MRGLLLLGAVLAGCGSPAPPPAPDVLLITLDTTRADALGAYGASPSPTPRLDALAAEAVRFAEAQSVTPLTLPAHASIHTGLYPDRHGVRSNDGFRLGEAHDTLAERFTAAGYTTAGFVAAAVLDDAFGLAQGFAHYGDAREASSSPREVAARPGQAVADELATWLVRAGEAPVFAWAHFYDPHLPLDPPEPHASAWEDAYLAEVAAMDAAVGQVLDAFALLRGERPRIVLVVGDHGEGRGDHGEPTHGLFVYRSTMHVPMLLAAPGLPPGEVEAPVSQVDIAPTLLALAALPAAEGVDGVDLGPLWRGEL